MAVEAQLPGYLWTEAINTANHIVNISPTSANLGMTPEQRYSGKLPHVNHLKIFGSLAFVHIPKTNRKKLDTKTLRCIFLGYDTESKVYRLYHPGQKKILLTRDVIIDETHVGFNYLSEPNLEPVTYLPSQPTEKTKPSTEAPVSSNSYDNPSDLQFLDPTISPPTSPHSPQSLPIFIQPQGLTTPQVIRRNPQRRRERPSRFNDYYMMAT